MPIRALVLAGSRRNGDPLAVSQGVSHKSLIVLHGKPVLDHVIAALLASQASQIVVAANDPAVLARARALGADTVMAAGSPSETVAQVLAERDAPLFVTTSDHPLLQSNWIDYLISQSGSVMDLTVMMARRSAIEEALPGSKRTYWTFRDGQWSGCNMFYLQTRTAKQAVDAWRALERDRKRPWRIAARIGLLTLLGKATRRWTMAQAIAHLGKKVGAKGTAITAPDGLAALDLDTPQDLAQITQIMENRAQAQACAEKPKN